MSTARSPSYVEARLDSERTIRASVCRNDRFIHLYRVRKNRWHEPIGFLSRSEAARLQHGLADLIATMPVEAE